MVYILILHGINNNDIAISVKCCLVGYLSHALWDLFDESIVFGAMYQMLAFCVMVGPILETLFKLKLVCKFDMVERYFVVIFLCSFVV